jgi:hypothetical protein
LRSVTQPFLAASLWNRSCKFV